MECRELRLYGGVVDDDPLNEADVSGALSLSLSLERLSSAQLTVNPHRLMMTPPQSCRRARDASFEQEKLCDVEIKFPSDHFRNGKKHDYQ
jgi:hypothetical protein